MAYPYAPVAPYPAPPPKPRRLRGPLTLGGVGLVLGVVGVLLWVGALVLFGGAVSSASTVGDEVRGDLVTEVEVPGEAEVDLEVGTWSVYAFVPSTPGPATTSELGLTSSIPDLEVTATGTDGAEVTVGEPSFPDTSTDSAADTDLVEVAEAHVTRPGTFTISVADAAGAEPATRAGIGPRADDGEALGKGLGGGLLVAAGFLVGGIGGVILFIASIWLLVAALA